MESVVEGFREPEQDRGQGRECIFEAPSPRDPQYAEAPEAAAEVREQPEIRDDRHVEAPDAGEGRCGSSDEFFTHGRSRS